MVEKKEYHSGIISGNRSREYNSTSRIINAKTSRASFILLDTSELSETAFNHSENEALYEEYPTIADELERNISKEKPIRLGVETEEEEKIESLVALKFDFEGIKKEGLSIFGSERLNSFDSIVLDAITTLCFDGFNRYISINMIFRVLAVSNNKISSDDYAREISNSITKLMFSHIVARINDELESFRILPANWTRAKLNGYEADCIHVLGKLPLHVYANSRNQVQKIGLELIEKPFENGKRKNKTQMDILHYLLRKIIALKKTSKRIMHEKISYETIYKELGYENATKKKNFKIRQKVKAILDAWKGCTLGNTKLISWQEIKISNMPFEIVVTYSKDARKKADYPLDYSFMEN